MMETTSSFDPEKQPAVVTVTFDTVPESSIPAEVVWRFVRELELLEDDGDVVLRDVAYVEDSETVITYSDGDTKR